MAATAWDLQVAWAEIVEADGSTSGSTGVVGLMSKANPIVPWGDRGMNTLPIIATLFPASAITRGAKEAALVTATADIITEPSATGLAWNIADRLVAITTQSNFNSTARTTAVDVLPQERTRRDLHSLEEGRQRVQVEWEFRFNR